MELFTLLVPLAWNYLLPWLVTVLFLSIPITVTYYVALKPCNRHCKYEDRISKLKTRIKKADQTERLLCAAVLRENISKHINGVIVIALSEALEGLTCVYKQIDSLQKDIDQKIATLKNLKEIQTEPSSVCDEHKSKPNQKKHLTGKKAKPFSVSNASSIQRKNITSTSEEKLRPILNVNYAKIRENLMIKKFKRPSKYNLQYAATKDSVMETLPYQFNYENRPKFKHGRRLHGSRYNCHNFNKCSADSMHDSKLALKCAKENLSVNEDSCNNFNTFTTDSTHDSKPLLKCAQEKLSANQESSNKSKLKNSLLIDFLNPNKGSPRIAVNDKHNISSSLFSNKDNDKTTLLKGIEFKIPKQVRKLRLKVPIKTRIGNLLLRLSVNLAKEKNGKPKIILKSKVLCRKKSIYMPESHNTETNIGHFNTMKKRNHNKHSLYTNCHLNRMEFVEDNTKYNPFMVSQLEKGDCQEIITPEEKPLCLKRESLEIGNNDKRILQQCVNLSKTCSTTDFQKNIPQEYSSFIHTTMLAVIEEDSGEESYEGLYERNGEGDNYKTEIRESVRAGQSRELCRVPSDIKNSNPFSNFKIQCSNRQVMHEQLKNEEGDVESSILEKLTDIPKAKKLTSFIEFSSFSPNQIIDQPMYSGQNYKNSANSFIQSNNNSFASLSKNLLQLYFNDQMTPSDSENNIKSKDLTNAESIISKIKIEEGFLVTSQEESSVMSRSVLCTRGSEVNYSEGGNGEPYVEEIAVLSAINYLDVD